MPYEKILITHKFGIISQSHKKELLERLKQRRQKIEEEIAKKYEKKDDSIELQVNEDFVKSYNEASFDKKTKLNPHCVRILEKLKKKLVNSDSLDDLTIQLCWAELSQLMQCNSPIQEECMDLFIHSLENAQISAMQIPTLFFLAETIIYWIRTDTIHQPLLRAYEIKLLKVGNLVFQRIYYHHLERTLEHENSLVEHLSVYLNGFDELKESYSPYPDACYYVSSMTKIGSLLTTQTASAATNRSLNDLPPSPSINSMLLRSSMRLFAALHHTGAKHRNNELDIEVLISDVFESSIRLGSQDWLEASLAFHIIGECAKQNARILDELIRMSGSKQKHSETSFVTASKSLAMSASQKLGLESWPWELGCVYVEVLADVCIHATNPLVKRRALLGFAKDAHEILKSKNLIVNSSVGYGLLETGKFQLGYSSSITKSQPEDWTWKIRYLAIKELVRICRTLTSREHEEFRQTCWCSLVVLQENETNKYVLEAIKVGQVNSKLEKKSTPMNGPARTQRGGDQHKVNFYFRFGQKLLELFNRSEVSEHEKQQHQQQFDVIMDDESHLDKTLKFEDIPYGRLQNNLDDSHPTTANNTRSNTRGRSGKHGRGGGGEDIGDGEKKRTTLRDEIIISNQFRMKVPGYYERKNFDLMRIVEDQYRKELEENIEKQKERRKTTTK